MSGAQNVKIKRIPEMRKKYLPRSYRSPLVPPETEQEAQVWAASYGVDTLYYYEEGKLWLVEVEDEAQGISRQG